MNIFFTDALLAYIQEFIDTIAVFIICFGAARAAYHLGLLLIYQTLDINYIRFQFGESLILGLEFMICSDVIGSLVEPNYYNLGLLALIVLIRSILGYFLSGELSELTPEQRKSLRK